MYDVWVQELHAATDNLQLFVSSFVFVDDTESTWLYILKLLHIPLCFASRDQY
jgi:hypothetical protein